MIQDRKIRTAICRQSFFIFFHFYFAHYVKYKTASFQREIFHLVEDEKDKNLFVIAFRGSGKSTILTTAYPIWAILGDQQKKFVLILCQTRSQAKQHMMNLRRELEENQLLKDDLGPFEEESDEWGSASLVFSSLNVRITAASTEQSIRGLRHNQHRPDLIVGDDVEDLNSTKTMESRQKTYQWLTGEVIPAGDKDTRLIVVGNLLHEDSLLMHLKNDLEEKQINGLFKEYPLIDGQGTIAWPGKYATEEEVENEKKRTGNEIAWQREYLLHIISDAGRVIHPEWIHSYDDFPAEAERFKFMYAATGIDLAISERESACYTAMVSAKVYGMGEDMKICILPYPINERMDSPATLKKAKEISENLGNGRKTELFIEDVGYQRSLIQNLQKENYPAVGFQTLGQDKRSRLATVAPAIENGTVLFPKKGAEALINQLIGFGVEKYNDLADAFVIIVSKAIENNEPYPSPFPKQGDCRNYGGITLDPEDHISFDQEF